MQMRVLLVSREYPPTFVGGIGRLAYYLSKYLKLSGVDVTVVAFGEPSLSNDLAIFFKPHSSIVSRSDGNLLGSFTIPIDIARFTVFVNRLVAEEKFDVVHVLEPYVGGFVQARNKVTTMHDTTYRELRAWLKYPLTKAFKRIAFYSTLGYIMDSASIKTSRIFTVPSIGTAYILKTFYHVPTNKIRIIPNGIESPIDKLNKKEARKFLNIPEEDVVIFTTAHHVARKRLETLIEAVRILKERGIKGFKVVIGGEGPLTSFYKSFAIKYNLENYITFTGWIQDNKLRYYYSACDIFVITSESETGPITLLEAAIRGKAIVTTNIDGLPALMKDGIDTIKYEVGNSVELANILEKLIGDEDFRAKIGINARMFAQRFTWKNVVRKLVNVYYELMVT